MKRRISANLLTLWFVVLPGALPAQAGLVKAIEYAGDHMFLTAHRAEIEVLDSGMIPGWVRTGVELWVHGAPEPGLVPVCRFYTIAFAPRSSHFYTADAAECEALKANPDWVYEGIAFYARLPIDRENCPSGTHPVSRTYNAGRGGAPNHLFTTYEFGTWFLTRVAGWSAEGTAFCIPGGTRDAVDLSVLLTGSRWRILPESALARVLHATEIVLRIDSLTIAPFPPQLYAELQFLDADGTRILASGGRFAIGTGEQIYGRTLFADFVTDRIVPGRSIGDLSLFGALEFMITGRNGMELCLMLTEGDYGGGWGETYSYCPAIVTRM